MFTRPCSTLAQLVLERVQLRQGQNGRRDDLLNFKCPTRCLAVRHLRYVMVLTPQSKSRPPSRGISKKRASSSDTSSAAHSSRGSGSV
jgi:hypothetical protein